MSGEKLPEPSIEEILASIRKIISDDEPEAEAVHDANASEDSVLELTNVVLEVPTGESDEEPHEEEAFPADPPEPPAAMPAPIPQPQPDSPEIDIDNIASEETVMAASSAFAKLSHTIPPPHEPPHASSGGKSVEDIVRELLRPILRQWIDQNLAAIVERSVERELRKISRKAEDS